MKLVSMVDGVDQDVSWSATVKHHALCEATGHSSLDLRAVWPFVQSNVDRINAGATSQDPPLALFLG